MHQIPSEFLFLRKSMQHALDEEDHIPLKSLLVSIRNDFQAFPGISVVFLNISWHVRGISKYFYICPMYVVCIF
jgi:hypothetical protein